MWKIKQEARKCPILAVQMCLMCGNDLVQPGLVVRRLEDTYISLHRCHRSYIRTQLRSLPSCIRSLYHSSFIHVVANRNLQHDKPMSHRPSKHFVSHRPEKSSII